MVSLNPRQGMRKQEIYDKDLFRKQVDKTIVYDEKLKVIFKSGLWVNRDS